MAATLGREIGPNEHVRHLNGDAMHNAGINLAVGTAADNAADKIAHNVNGRTLRNGDVREIRVLAGRLGFLALAARYGIGVGHVRNIVSRRAWRGLP